MKIIISHDVDHLFAKEHIFRDLIYPKLWVRSLIWLLKGQITFKEFYLRCVHCFKKERHCLYDVMAFDKSYGVDSAFFFGMNQGLGMSYYPNEAKSVIKKVADEGFAVGVHGIEYTDKVLIKKEYDAFLNLMGFAPCGIRMHYVRYNDNTFENVAAAGYALQSITQLINRVFLAIFNIIYHARVDMICQKFFIKCIQSRINCAHLC